MMTTSKNQQKPPSEIKVRLIIQSDEASPDELTRTLGLEPSETGYRGEKIHPNAAPTHKRNKWMLLPPPHLYGTSIDAQVEAVLSKVEENIGAFNNLPEDAEVKLFCSVWLYDGNARPYLGLEVESIRTLSKIGAKFEIDLY